MLIGEDVGHYVGAAVSQSSARRPMQFSKTSEHDPSIFHSPRQQDKNSPPNPTNTNPASLQSLHILHVLPLFSCRDRPSQRRVNVCSNQPVGSLRFSCCPTLSQIRNEAFGQSNGDVEALAFVRGLEPFREIAGAGGNGNEVGVEVEVFLSEVERGGEVFCS